MDWYFGVLKKYAVFEGRARRMEYWMFALVNVVVMSSLAIVDAMVGATSNTVGFLSVLYALVVLLPSLAGRSLTLDARGRTIAL